MGVDNQPLGRLKGSALKTIADIAKPFLPEAIGLTFSENALRVAFVDDGHAAVVKAEVTVEDCARSFAIALPLEKFTEGAKPLLGDEEVELSVEGNQFRMGRGRRVLRVGIDADDSPCKVQTPVLDWDIEFEVPTQFLKDLARYGCDDKQQHPVWLHAKGGTLSVRSGDDSFGYEDGVEIDTDGEASVEMSSDYLHHLFKPIAGKTATLSMSTNYPMRVQYEIPGGKAVALLAPRLENK